MGGFTNPNALELVTEILNHKRYAYIFYWYYIYFSQSCKKDRESMDDINQFFDKAFKGNGIVSALKVRNMTICFSVQKRRSLERICHPKHFNSTLVDRAVKSAIDQKAIKTLVPVLSVCPDIEFEFILGSTNLSQIVKAWL
ncbi:hypothetical protein PHYBLDRAFT_169781 [Phycomyces blakesleeanus NRRL 1555(-)]|uniref:Uncharacterized protein n=1 Tax=Phycomyces blakesleeanus (strain ATCC 8743b / DSM 1359 / FGSC 10004 / NBRC 33097 / NRRL 1555) TaxID=763407 RepID=A0A167M5I7_PHYB8|nr:hypothetical protein PHYBLDRAFT_169781 [Phycomyces blakesleeanus NRRL 1555(-)]OAD71864.1 hypothetical protein PHYBLDRAFT_169781 [Phycomyces blakesleeanus NRRL 1555(-)]|eukprot:XP_018289904.1 hypothetical protein PHYBLDRAFT_169781 [Phycomyces blakesleeanus NRRL 1555(-)]